MKEQSPLLVDQTTQNLKNLKSVSFLNDHSSLAQQKSKELVRKFLEGKKEEKQISLPLLKVIKHNKVKHMEILKKNEAALQAALLAKKNQKVDEKSAIETLLQGDSSEEMPGRKPEKIADGFVRSDRNLQMRERSSLDE